MPAIHSADLTANGVRLHYARTGGDLPPLVLLHGFSDDGLCWASLIAALADSYDIVAIDARGHGRSAAPERGYGAPAHAADVAGVIEQLGLGRPTVIGHSMGAITALALAATYPDATGAIVLEDPPPWWLGDAVPPPFAPAWVIETRAWLDGLRRQSREAIIADKRAAAPTWPAEDIAPWAESKLRVNDNVFNHDTPPLDWAALARRIACPALLFRGDPERGAILSADLAESLRALIPQLQIVHIPGASHDIRRDRFDAYLAAVRAFLGDRGAG